MKLNIIVIVVFALALLAFNASAGCGKWVVRDNTDFLEDPTFDAAMSSTPGGNAPGASAENSSMEKAQTEVKEKVAPAMDVSGKWRVLLGEALVPLNLILIQSGERVQGYGSLSENGIEIPTTATGTLSEDALGLDVKLVVDGSINKVNREYKLSLTKDDASFRGSYKLYVSSKLIEKGNATATRSN